MTGNGTIKKLVADRGFGFIEQQPNGPDLFFHHTAVENHGFENLNEGDAVEFEEDEKSDKPRAKSVRPG